MKKLALLIGLLPAVVSAESIMANYYVVVSDVFDESVKPGTCLVTGKIVDMNEQAIPNGTIANFDRSRFTVSNEQGAFSLLLSTRDTAIFFYHENYGEVVIWKYNFQSQHKVVINFYSMEYSDIPTTVEKPVIYLYSEQATDVSLSLTSPEITFTYPAYKGGWNVTTAENGKMINKADGKTYPYLFWEAQSENISYRYENEWVSGSLVETENCTSFFENMLTAAGLNSTEMTDFITYWGPRLAQKKYAFVQFLVDDEVDVLVGNLDVSPQPDVQRRIYMLYTPLDNPVVPFDYEAQHIQSFNRDGLTLLEWGGSEIPLHQILP